MIPERIKEFNSNRLPQYTGLKYKLMSEEPFRFFRGTCHLFYEDLSTYGNIPVSPCSWISGDLHLENFGSFKGDNRLVYFDLNDFDEGILAPAAWDLTRIVTSIFVGLEPLEKNHKEITDIADLFLQTCSRVLRKGKARYIEQLTAKGITRTFLDKICARKQKDLVAKHTIVRENKLMLQIDNAKLFPIEKTLKKELTYYLTQWVEDNKTLRNTYEAVDVGFRIAGTGSIGVKRYLFLLKKINAPKYLLLDMKQAMPSSVFPYCTIKQPSWSSEAERVVGIQERMQNISPALLSSTSFKNDFYVIKEMQPTEDRINFAVIRDRYKEISRVIKDFALLASSAMLRSSGRQGSAIADELIAFGEATDWQKGILDYGVKYSIKVKEDYKEYLKAYKSGFFSKT